MVYDYMISHIEQANGNSDFAVRHCVFLCASQRISNYVNLNISDENGATVAFMLSLSIG